MYINIIYRELHNKGEKKKHRRKGAAQGQERDNKGEKKKRRRKGAAPGQERDKKATSSYEYDLSGLFNETRAAQGQERDNKGDLDLF